MHFLGQREDHCRFPIQHTPEQANRREFGTQTYFVIRLYKLFKRKKKQQNKRINNFFLSRFSVFSKIL